jgi:hypothetical protein
LCFSLAGYDKRIPKYFSCNGTGFFVHSIKPLYGGVHVKLHSFLNSAALDGGKNFTSRTHRFTPGKAMLVHQNWVGRTAALKVPDQEKIVFSTGIRTPDHLT